MSAQQIEQREKKYPDDVDEVPVQPGHVDGRVIFRRESSALRPRGKNREQRNPDNHVQRVQARHREIKREKQLRIRRIGAFEVERRSGYVMADELLVIL